MIEWLRLVLYGLGVMFAIALAGQMFRLNLWLARLMGLAMAGWAINCALLFALLACLMLTGDPRPEWSETLFIANSVLLGAIPILLYLGFLREEQK